MALTDTQLPSLVRDPGGQPEQPGTRWRISPDTVGPTIRHLLRQTGQAKCV